MARLLKFDGVWAHGQWHLPGYVEVTSDGFIKSISQTPEGPSKPEVVSGFAIPGFLNGHSHAFQYAMAGRAERGGKANDDFWSWRDAMYRLAGAVSVEQVESIATMLYSEMLCQGYTAVTEFHYLHGREDGGEYDDPRAMALALIHAAKKAGIQITLVPVLYQQSGLGLSPTREQRRFIVKSTADYRTMVTSLASEFHDDEDIVIGSGIHSLRAVDPQVCGEVLQGIGSGPIHLHIAEQDKEVSDVKAYLGKRPVAWLLEQKLPFMRLNLVHATHLDNEEIEALAASQANVVICPSTEANLGDGFFPIAEYLKRKKSFAIGSDSHISLSPFEELRWLDYGQRLLKQKRGGLFSAGVSDLGELLFHAAQVGGRMALGRADKVPCDFLLIDCDHPLIAGRDAKEILASVVYSGTSAMISRVMRRGEWVVTNGVHTKKTEIRAAFQSAMSQLYPLA